MKIVRAEQEQLLGFHESVALFQDRGRKITFKADVRKRSPVMQTGVRKLLQPVHMY